MTTGMCTTTGEGERMLEGNPKSQGAERDPHLRLKDFRLSNMRASSRCLALTRRGTPCQCPAMRNRTRCRLHGGKAGAPRGERNGAWRDGSWTQEAMEFRRAVSRTMKALRTRRPTQC